MIEDIFLRSGLFAPLLMFFQSDKFSILENSIMSKKSLPLSKSWWFAPVFFSEFYSCGFYIRPSIRLDSILHTVWRSSNSLFFYVIIWLSQHHLLKSSSHWIILVPLLKKIYWYYVTKFLSRPSVVFSWLCLV